MKHARMTRSMKRRLLGELFDELVPLGFYDFATEELARLRARTLDEEDVHLDETGRVFFMDAEVVYESGPRQFLSDIERFLVAVQAPIREFTEVTRQGESYEIRLNGRTSRLWSRYDFEPEYYEWREPSLGFLRALNVCLEAENRQERAYVDVIANDSMIVFMTPEMHRAIEGSEAAEKRVVPVLNRP